jgi:aryl-alcohol dehydrogenase-like predicted oxidoreductase
MMNRRRLGRLGWQIGEIGYGTWGIGGGEGGWTGNEDAQSLAALHLAVDQGVNFLDTAWIYGRGHSEVLCGRLLAERPAERIYVATKIPPADRRWPSTRTSRLADVFPPDHIRDYTERSRRNLGVDRIDLMQFHVWEDAWADDPAWQDTMADLKARGLIDGIGISINRWEPWNAMAALRTGLIDTVQVIYNIFDQAPEDELFPLCRDLDVGVIARVPFDEGTLTGTLTLESRWPEGDWRNSYFVPENLAASVARADRLKPLVPAGETMAGMALRFILANPDVHTVIPGMRSPAHVRANTAVADGRGLPPDLLAALRDHRWDREPTEWSQ